jgi:hypothetical protein
VGQEVNPLKMTEDEPFFFLSTQIEMIVFITVFEFMALNGAGEHIQAYSEILSALSFLITSYWKSSFTVSITCA